jgi:hypothetical protein
MTAIRRPQGDPGQRDARARQPLIRERHAAAGRISLAGVRTRLEADAAQAGRARRATDQLLPMNWKRTSGRRRPGSPCTSTSDAFESGNTGWLNRNANATMECAR